MQTHRFKSWRLPSAKQEKNKILSSWEFIEAGRRNFAIFIGTRKISKPEGEISKVIRQMGLTFYKEVSFDLKRRYDFYIPQLELVIEYDGHHHFGTLGALKKDWEKDLVLKKMGISLLRYSKNDDLGKQLGIDLVLRINRS